MTIHSYLSYIRGAIKSAEICLCRSGIAEEVVASASASSTLLAGQVAPTQIIPEAWRLSDDVQLTPGSSGGITTALLQCKLSSRRVVAVERPGYPMFESVANAYDLDVISFARFPSLGERPARPLEDVLARGDVGAVCITDPHNPTGYELTAEEVRDTAALASAAGAAFVVDRVFADFARRPRAYEEGQAPTGYIARSFSKSLALGGKRYGWLTTTGGAESPAEAIDILFGQPVSSLEAERRFTSLATLWAMHSPVALRTVEHNRVLLRNWVADTPAVRLLFPEATTPYATLELTRDHGSDFVSALFEATSVALVPGAMFGMPRRFTRIGLGNPSSEVQRGLDRTSAYLSQLSR